MLLHLWIHRGDGAIPIKVKKKLLTLFYLTILNNLKCSIRITYEYKCLLNSNMCQNLG